MCVCHMFNKVLTYLLTYLLTYAELSSLYDVMKSVRAHLKGTDCVLFSRVVLGFLRTITVDRYKP